MRTIIIAAAILLTTTLGAGAAEIKAMITSTMESAMDELLPAFERASKHKVVVSYDSSGRLSLRLRKGEPADMILIGSAELDLLIKDRKVGERINVSRSGFGLAVKKGASHPDISTPEALKRTLLAARTIGQPSLAAGGAAAFYIQRVYARLGITEQVQPKLRFASGGPNGRVSLLVASGEATIGIQHMAELMSNPGVDVVGPLPEKLQQFTVNAAGISVNAREPDAARALIRYLTSPRAKAIYKAKGLGL